MKKTLYILVFIAVSYNTTAQFTSIPDTGFEQALIDLNIDSDGVVDGQVLIADIENVTELTSLDVSNNLAQRILDVSQNSLTELDLSNNTLLEELYCGNPTDDVWPQTK